MFWVSRRHDCYATSDASIEETFTIYGQFERATGARLNRGKSKGLWAGTSKGLWAGASNGLWAGASKGLWADAWKARTDTPYGLQWVKDLPLLDAVFNVGDYS